jgi:outer membrane protein assembly factor BamB
MRRVPVLLSFVAVVLLGVLSAGRLPIGTAAQDVTPGAAAPGGAPGVADARVDSAVAATDDGVFVAASVVVMEPDAPYSQDATLIALDPATGAERWRFATGARFITPPVLADGLAYAYALDYAIGDSTNSTGTLYAVDAATGAERWRFAAGAPYSPPVVTGGVVYAAGGGHLYALDGASGAERWRRPDVPPLASELAVDRGAVYAAFFGDGCATWHLAAFDAATGAERSSWSIETAGNCAIGGPAVADGVAYVVRLTGEGGQGDGYLAALDPATGDEGWRWGFDPGGLVTTPVVHAGTVYVTALDALHAVDAERGTERWSFDATPWVSPAVAADGALFVHAGGANQAALYALEAATGGERWRSQTAALPSWSPRIVAVAAGVAYAGGGETIYAVDAASGAERWRARLALALPTSTTEGGASPAVGSQPGSETGPPPGAIPAEAPPQPGTPEPGGAAQSPGPGDHPYHFDEGGHFSFDLGATARHWCKPVAGGVLECLIYASDAPDAPLVAVELVVEPATYEGFDPAEQRLWHPVETNFAKLILLGDPASLGDLPTGQPRLIGTEPATSAP